MNALEWRVAWSHRLRCEDYISVWRRPTTMTRAELAEAPVGARVYGPVPPFMWRRDEEEWVEVLHAPAVGVEVETGRRDAFDPPPPGDYRPASSDHLYTATPSAEYRRPSGVSSSRARTDPERLLDAAQFEAEAARWWARESFGLLVLVCETVGVAVPNGVGGAAAMVRDVLQVVAGAQIDEEHTDRGADPDVYAELGADLAVGVHVSQWGRPAMLEGSPDNWSPADPPEVEVIAPVMLSVITDARVGKRRSVALTAAQVAALRLEEAEDVLEAVEDEREYARGYAEP